MKKILISLLVISIGFNIFFLQRKIRSIICADEKRNLIFYKKISYEKGYACFLNQMKKNYSETSLKDKYFIVYRWDSLLYDAVYKYQMKSLDSMAANFGKYKLEYIFATEMEESASKSFLKRNNDKYNNAKMLFGMNDYISGLYSNNYIKMNKPQVIHLSSTKNKNQDDSDLNFKQKFCYLIMDSKGKVLYTNEDRFMVVKDTALLNKLHSLLPDKKLKILN